MQAVINGYAEEIARAVADKAPLRLRGAGTKDFYGARLDGRVLDTRACHGVVSYEPTELVVTARAGTSLLELERTLAEGGQMLAFEPPHFGPGATVGGCVASGLSGPRRAYSGSVRDFVLGVRMLDGRGQDLRFGGQVIKNVAGYDLSRLMTGSLGTLGLLLEVSFKVLPLPKSELTLRFELDEQSAVAKMNQWSGTPLPVSATCWHEGVLTVRLSGAEAGVRAARAKLGGEEVADGPGFWASVREQSHAFFRGAEPLWRLSLRPTARALGLPGRQLIEWGGALRWVAGPAPAQVVRDAAARCGGHATLFRARDKATSVFHPLAPAAFKLHLRLKQTFDPAGIFCPGRMYEGF
ncbi:MAG TPA: glycolate oxidase subunit GlcE [Burkholderiales bacterium]|nr:glycolate oxidase subunit GlcE [Burkholderiales bacterium]